MALGKSNWLETLKRLSSDVTGQFGYIMLSI